MTIPQVDTLPLIKRSVEYDNGFIGLDTLEMSNCQVLHVCITQRACTKTTGTTSGLQRWSPDGKDRNRRSRTSP